MCVYISWGGELGRKGKLEEFVFTDISIIGIIFIEGELRGIREQCKGGAKFGQFVVFLFPLEKNEHFSEVFQQV